MKHAHPPLTQSTLEAYAASALLWLTWLAGVIFRLGVPRKSRRLHLFLCRLEREVESVCFLKALYRFGQPPRRLRRPGARPRGFRAQRRARLRQFHRDCGVRARKASPAQRLAALAAALANPAPHVAYFIKRFLNGLRGVRFIAVAPPADACAELATPSVAFADSS